MQNDKRDFVFVLACARLEIRTFNKDINCRQNKFAIAFVTAKIFRKRYGINIKGRLELSARTFDKIIMHAAIIAVILEAFFIEHSVHECRIQSLVIRRRHKHHRKIAFTRRKHFGIVAGTDFRHAAWSARREHIFGVNNFLHLDIFPNVRRMHCRICRFRPSNRSRKGTYAKKRSKKNCRYFNSFHIR